MTQPGGYKMAGTTKSFESSDSIKDRTWSLKVSSESADAPYNCKIQNANDHESPIGVSKSDVQFHRHTIFFPSFG